MSTLAAPRELSPDELARFGAEIDALRARTVADLGERDARYIRNIFKAVRYTEVAGRVLLMSGLLLAGAWMWGAWALGVALLAISKILDNMELGHNVIHGQFDWMGDPAFQGKTFEWDIVGTSDNWRKTHNFKHHTYTNVHGMDDDIGYDVLRHRIIPSYEAEAEDKDSFYVSGRGELQLAVLIETMRREGFELGISRPRVVLKRDESGQLLEPIEEVIIDVDEEHSGVVVQKMSERKADMLEMRPSGGNRLRLAFHAPTRGLIGYQGELLTDTRGTAIMNRLFHDYMPYKGEIGGRRNGVLIAMETGEAVAYALWNLEDRGPMMIEPGWKVYQGMIVGEHTRENDLEVNVLKGKKLTNIRTTSKDEAVRLTPPIRMTLERSLAWIDDDELVEVTPKSIRLRKAILDPNERKRSQKMKQDVA